MGDVVKDVLSVIDLLKSLNKTRLQIQKSQKENIEKLSNDIALCENTPELEVVKLQSLKIEGTTKLTPEQSLKLKETLNESRTRLNKFYENELTKLNELEDDLKQKLDEADAGAIFETAKTMIDFFDA